MVQITPQTPDIHHWSRVSESRQDEVSETRRCGKFCHGPTNEPTNKVILGVGYSFEHLCLQYNTIQLQNCKKEFNFLQILGQCPKFFQCFWNFVPIEWKLVSGSRFGSRVAISTSLLHLLAVGTSTDLTVTLLLLIIAMLIMMMMIIAFGAQF